MCIVFVGVRDENNIQFFRATVETVYRYIIYVTKWGQKTYTEEEKRKVYIIQAQTNVFFDDFVRHHWNNNPQWPPLLNH